MFKRATWLTVGFSLGVGTTVAAAHQVRKRVNRYQPSAMANRVTDSLVVVARPGRGGGRRGTDCGPHARVGAARTSTGSLKNPGGQFARGRYDLSVAAPRTADELRTAFTDFFAARGHTVVPSSSLIPHDPSLMLTIAGMVQFKPYFVGDETPPYPRATSVQKVARAGGKDSDLDNVGRTNRHFSFFEMLGNFSFGDYFKAEVIPWAWELVTEVFELDPDRIWVTVHNTDDEAERIWTDVVGPAPRTGPAPG